MNASSLTSRFALSLLAFAALPVAGLAQGALVPAGAPAPMMKTLAQIEARVDVATLPGDATALHVISQPGSYYLTGNIKGVAGKGGIRIESDHVTLDLNGFMLDGPGTANTSLPGIYLPDGEVGSHFWISICNGFIRQWGGGGVHAGQSGSLQLADLKIFDVFSYGIFVMGGSTMIERCHVTAAQNAGIYVGTSSGSDAIVRDCVVVGVNSAATATGIYSGYGIVENCRVRNVGGVSARGIVSGLNTGRVANCDVSQVSASGAGNQAVGIDAPLIVGCTIANIIAANSASGYGVYMTYPGQILHTRVSDVTGLNAMGIYSYYATDDFNGNGSTTVQSCFVANLNASSTAAGIHARQVLDCQVTAVQGTNAGGTALGIGTYAGGIVKNCTVSNVEGNGIDLTYPASAIGNSVNAAGKDGTGTGIYISIAGCRVEGNRVSNSPVGIQQTAVSSLVIGNFAQGNNTNFSGVNAALITSTAAGVAAGSSVLNVSY